MWMKANQMPTVERQLCDTTGCKKAPSQRGFPDNRNNYLGTRFGYISGLWSFLPLDDLELHFIALGERLETAALYRAEMHKDVGSTLA